MFSADFHHYLIKIGQGFLPVVTSDGAIRHVFEEIVDLGGLFICAAIRILDNLEELGEFDLARSVIIDVHDHIEYLLTAVGEPQTDERFLKLINADCFRPIVIKGEKTFFQLPQHLIRKRQSVSFTSLVKPFPLLFLCKLSHTGFIFFSSLRWWQNFWTRRSISLDNFLPIFDTLDEISFRSRHLSPLQVLFLLA